jgi:hypothetical protein
MVLQRVGAPAAGHTLVAGDRGQHLRDGLDAEDQRQPVGRERGWRCERGQRVNSALASRHIVGEELEVAIAKHTQLGVGVDANAGRHGTGGALAGDNHHVAEGRRALKNVGQGVAHRLAKLCIAAEGLDLVDDDQLARVGGESRREAAGDQRLVARREAAGCSGEGGSERLGLGVAVDTQGGAGIAHQLDALAVRDEDIGPGRLQRGANEAMQGGAFARAAFAGDDQTHAWTFFLSP